MNGERFVGGDDRLRRFVHAAVQDQPERTMRAVLGEQHDGLGKVGIEHLRHRYQQHGGERRVRHTSILLQAFRSSDRRPSHGPGSPTRRRLAHATASSTTGVLALFAAFRIPRPGRSRTSAMFGIAAIADHRGEVASQPGHRQIGHRAAFNQGVEIEIAPLPQVRRRQTVALRRLPGRIIADRRRKIPRADILADVAAVGVIADAARADPPGSGRRPRW